MSMNKVGILVLGAFAPLILDEVLALFDASRFRIFLHIDAKQDLPDYVSKLRHLDRVVLIQQRVAVFWGGFSMVEAEIALMEAAVQYPDVSNLILVSDDSVPLVSPDAIYEALITIPDRITCVPNGRPRQWYERFFYSDSKFSYLRIGSMEERYFTEKDSGNIQRMEALRKKGKKNLPIFYFGRQWWALGRPSALEILAYIESDEHFVESFRFSLFPDELFFPTAYRMCFPDHKTPEIPTYADYGRPVHPWIFTSSQEIRDTKFGSEHLFVRKIKPSLPNIVRELAEGWT